MMIISNGKIKEGSWHVGETMRVPTGRIITFEMDSHELQAVLKAMEDSGVVIERHAEILTPIY